MENVFSPSRKVPSTSAPWADTYDVQTSTTRRPIPHIEDSEGDAWWDLGNRSSGMTEQVRT
jgi:hypothetical protein